MSKATKVTAFFSAKKAGADRYAPIEIGASIEFTLDPDDNPLEVLMNAHIELKETVKVQLQQALKGQRENGG